MRHDCDGTTNKMKQQIIKNLCYTELVYDRINKKLKTVYSRPEIEALLLKVLEATDESDYIKRGKNYYITNREHGIRVTVNSNTCRIITVDRV